MEDTNSFIIADDDTVYPFGLKIALTKINSGHKIMFAENGIEVVKILSKCQKVKEKVDIVFMDYNMPIMGGAETTKIIRGEFPETKVIAYSIFKDITVIREMIHAGVHGFVLKESKRDEVKASVGAVLSGRHFYSEEIHGIIQKIVDNGMSIESSPEEKNTMTETEIEIFKLHCKGYKNPEIAKIRSIELSTVESHLRHIKEKKGFRNKKEMFEYAIAKGWIASLSFFTSP